MVLICVEGLDETRQIQVECFLYIYIFNCGISLPTISETAFVFLCQLNALHQAPHSNPFKATDIYTNSFLFKSTERSSKTRQKMNKTSCHLEVVRAFQNLGCISH